MQTTSLNEQIKINTSISRAL